MRATRFNHVSVHADDLEESARFYEDVFGMERVATPDFGSPRVLWLALGDQQLHLFNRRMDAPHYHHFAIDVDDFEAAYVKARELGLLDSATFGTAIREFANGAVQMYIRDPAGNLVEVDWPDVATLDRTVVTDISRIEDERPQTGEAARATLYHAAMR